MTAKRKRGPKPLPDGERTAHHVAVRLTTAQLERVDALIPGLSTPWQTMTRSDALRALIETGLPIVEGIIAKGGRP